MPATERYLRNLRGHCKGQHLFSEEYLGTTGKCGIVLKVHLFCCFLLFFRYVPQVNGCFWFPK